MKVFGPFLRRVISTTAVKLPEKKMSLQDALKRLATSPSPPVTFQGQETFPYINRAFQLEQTAEILLRNQENNIHRMDKRVLRLVVSAQLFGIGKTRFGERLASLFQLLYGENQCHYLCLSAYPSAASFEHQVGAFLIQQLQDVLGDATEKKLRIMLTDPFFDFNNLIGTIQTSLASKQHCVFLHLDEFHLSGDNAKRFNLDGLPELKRYHRVWRNTLMGILSAPNFFLFISGRDPTLAMIGRSGVNSDNPNDYSPCLSHHVILPTLNTDEINTLINILAQNGLRFSIGAEDREELVKALRFQTGGVPRLLSFALCNLLVNKGDTVAEHIRRLQQHDPRLNNFFPSSVFVARAKEDFGLILTLVYGGYWFSTQEMGSQWINRIVKLADQYSLYTETDTNERLRVVMPGWMRCYMVENIQSSLLSMADLPGLQNAGAKGQQLETALSFALRFHLALSLAAGKVSPTLQRLLPADAFKGVRWDNEIKYPSCGKWIGEDINHAAPTLYNKIVGYTTFVTPKPQSSSFDFLLQSAGDKCRWFWFQLKHRQANISERDLEPDLAQFRKAVEALNKKGAKVEFTFVLCVYPAKYIGKLPQDIKMHIPTGKELDDLTKVPIDPEWIKMVEKMKALEDKLSADI